MKDEMGNVASSQLFNIGGIQIRVVKNGFNASLPSFDMFEFIIREKGLGPGIHYHQDMDEFFYIISGEVIFTIAGKKIIARAGDHLTVPKSIVHQWSSNTNSLTQMLIMFSPSRNQVGYFSGLERLQKEGLSWEKALDMLSTTFDNLLVVDSILTCHNFLKAEL